jgi:hypothetical protein
MRKHRLQVYSDDICAVKHIHDLLYVSCGVLYYMFWLFLRIAMEFPDFDHVSNSSFSIKQ